MERIQMNWTPQNEYTRPLEGQPYYRNSGIIYALDHRGDKYAVSRIDFERFDEQNFQYIFSPEWSVIDALPATIFQGIPGIDMSLRLNRYYRVNMTPVFISERTPSEGREDLWELLDSVNLDYYDRFEWLLRTSMRCGTDNLIVERANIDSKVIDYQSAEKQFIAEKIQPGDRVEINNLQTVASSNRELRSIMLRILRSGADLMLKDEDRLISDDERSAMLKLLIVQETLDTKNWYENRAEGIKRAKAEGKYTGRKKQRVDPYLLRAVAEDFVKQRISESEAMDRLGIKSRSTFYRRLKEIRSELPQNSK